MTMRFPNARGLANDDRHRAAHKDIGQEAAKAEGSFRARDTCHATATASGPAQSEVDCARHRCALPRRPVVVHDLRAVASETAVVAATHTVYRGETIEQGDLTRITLRGFLQTVPAARLTDLVRQRAAYDLIEGIGDSCQRSR